MPLALGIDGAAMNLPGSTGSLVRTEDRAGAATVATPRVPEASQQITTQSGTRLTDTSWTDENMVCRHQCSNT